MKKRPLALTIIALLHFLHPPYFVLQFMFSQDIPLTHFFSIAKAIYWPITEQPNAVILSLVSIIVGIGLLRVRTWAYWLFFAYAIHTILFTIFDVIQLNESGVFSPYLRFPIIILTLGASFYFIQKHVRSPYFNPSLRWWENAPRFKVNDLNVTISIDGKPVLCDEVYDLSKGGLFVVSNSQLVLGKTYHASFKLLDEVPISSEGSVVWVCNKVKNHPDGFGFMFKGMTPHCKRQLKAYLRSLNRELLR